MTSTSEGASPAVNACQGASQYVNRLFTVGAGVMSDEFEVVGVGVSNVKPVSEENVTSCAQPEMVTFEARAVNMVAHTVVSRGA